MTHDHFHPGCSINRFDVRRDHVIKTHADHTGRIGLSDVITSPAGAVAKYCDEYVCVSVCLYVCPRGYLRKHTRRSLPNFSCTLPIAVVRVIGFLKHVGFKPGLKERGSCGYAEWWIRRWRSDGWRNRWVGNGGTGTRMSACYVPWNGDIVTDARVLSLRRVQAQWSQAAQTPANKCQYFIVFTSSSVCGRSIVISVSICLFVCLSSRKPHVQISQNFMYICYLWRWFGPPLTSVQ